MLGIDDKYSAGRSNGKFITVAQEYCKKSAVKCSLGKPISIFFP